VQDIARVIDLPVTTVQGRLYGGLRKLRDLLDDGDERSPGSVS
jgi:DNA-directed RNA polymerase specialized sigma24 family protein